MASFTIAAGDRAVHAKTLTANTADTVTFTDYSGSRTVDVLAHPASPAPIYFTSDGSIAAVEGAKTLVVLPGSSITITIAGRGPTPISLISAGAAVYSVQDVS